MCQDDVTRIATCASCIQGRGGTSVERMAACSGSCVKRMMVCRALARGGRTITYSVTRRALSHSNLSGAPTMMSFINTDRQFSRRRYL